MSQWNKKQRLGLASVTVATITVVSLTGALPASADATPNNHRSECASYTYWCVWPDGFDVGTKYQFAEANTTWSSWNIYKRDSSSYNPTAYAFVLKTWQGGSYCSAPHGTYWRLHNPENSGIGNGKRVSC